jgi:putative ABC transport system permease protein
LAIGIAGCLIIGLFVWDERQYDEFVPGGNNIYRIYDENKDNNTTTYAAVTSPAYATFLKANFQK